MEHQVTDTFTQYVSPKVLPWEIYMTKRTDLVTKRGSNWDHHSLKNQTYIQQIPRHSFSNRPGNPVKSAFTAATAALHLTARPRPHSSAREANKAVIYLFPKVAVRSKAD